MMTASTFGLQVALAFFQVVFSGSTTIGAGNVVGTPTGGGGAQLTADCAGVTDEAWDAVELQYTPMEMDADETQEGDGCAAWSLPSNYLTAGGHSLP